MSNHQNSEVFSGLSTNLETWIDWLAAHIKVEISKWSGLGGK